MFMVKFAFKREERLSRNTEYKKVYQGKRLQNAFFTLYFVPNAKQINRIGFVAGKKCLKLSARRNRLKRLLREVYRLNKAKIKGNFDLVIVARKIDFPLNYKEVKKRVLELLEKVNSYKIN